MLEHIRLMDMLRTCLMYQFLQIGHDCEKQWKGMIVQDNGNRTCRMKHLKTPTAPKNSRRKAHHMRTELKQN